MRHAPTKEELKDLPSYLIDPPGPWASETELTAFLERMNRLPPTSEVLWMRSDAERWLANRRKRAPIPRP